MSGVYRRLVATVFLSLMALASEAAEGGGKAVGLHIDDFIGTIRIVRSDTDSIDVVSLTDGAADLGRIVVDAASPTDLRVRGVPASLLMNCVRTNGELSISFDDGVMRSIRDFPNLVISVPPDANVKLEMRAGSAEISETENLEVLAGGCATIIVSKVSDTLRLTTTGAAKLTVENAGRADIDASNGGQIEISKVHRFLSACLGHASRLTSNEVLGQAQVFQSGTSRAKLSGVKLDELTAELDGASSLDVSGASSNSRISVSAAARAQVSSGISLDDIMLMRAGRLVVDGKRWKGSRND